MFSDAEVILLVSTELKPSKERKETSADPKVLSCNNVISPLEFAGLELVTNSLSRLAVFTH